MDPFYCPITSCQLKSADCSLPYTGTEFQQIDANFDLKISSYVSPAAPVSVCVECTNGYQVIPKPNFQIIFEDYLSSLCSSALSLTSLSSKTLNYADPLFLISTTNQDLFSNSEPILCPIQSCTLKTPDCLNAYPGTDLQVALNQDISLSSSLFIGGQTHQVCIVCSTIS